jgi:hypothetical protein
MSETTRHRIAAFIVATLLATAGVFAMSSVLVANDAQAISAQANIAYQDASAVALF